MMRNLPRGRVLAALPLVMGMLGTGAVRADIHTNWVSNQAFYVAVTHMPDLDQRRKAATGKVGLPGDGSMYCVPTATMNMVMYLANHGYPQVLPGPCNWQSQSRYNIAGSYLANMGTLMGTTPGGGTGGGGWYNGALSWLLPYFKFIVVKDYASGWYAPTLTSLSKRVRDGEIVSLAYGRYDLKGTNGNIVYVGDRNGGHAITFAAGYRVASTQTLWIRDPADDSADLYSQSQFCNRAITVKDVLVVGPNYTRVMSALNHPSGDGKIRLIDGVVAIRPIFGWGMGLNDAMSVSLYQPVKLDGGNYPDVIDLPSPTSTPILDAVPVRDASAMAMLCAGVGTAPASIQIVDLDGAVHQLATLANARKATLGRTGELYVVAGRTIHQYDVDADAPHVAQVTPPAQVEALAFDHAADDLVLLAVQDRKLLRYKKGLVGTPLIHLLPAGVPLAGDATVTVNPATGRYWFFSEASDSLFEAYQIAGGPFTAIEVALPAVQHPTGLDFDDNGHLFVTCGAGLLEFRKNGNTWEQEQNSAFKNVAVGRGFHIARSRTNFDPATMTGPGWVNLPPEQTLVGKFESDNPGDMNCDEVVDFVDINAFVLALTNPTQYGATYPSCHLLNGDLNQDGQMTFADINAFVALLGGTDGDLPAGLPAAQ